MLAGLNTLIKISYVDDTEIFKSCLDYWQLFVADIFGSCTTHALPGELAAQESTHFMLLLLAVRGWVQC